MEPGGWIKGIWVLAITVGVTATSCTLQRGEQAPRPLPASEPAVAAKATVQAAYGNLPLSFEANEGQSDAQVQFLARGHGYSLFLTPSEAVLALHAERGMRNASEVAWIERSGIQDAGGRDSPDFIRATTSFQPPTPNPQPPVVLRLQLVGANPNPHIAGLEELPGKVNYLLGNDPQRWRTNIPTYAKVQYEGVYPGVDLVYYGNQGQVEYDFVVAPGVDPQVITLAFADLGGVGLNPAPTIDTNGDLILQTEGGDIHLHKPLVYQEVDGIRQEIAGGYILLSETPDSRLRTPDCTGRLCRGRLRHQQAAHHRPSALLLHLSRRQQRGL